jgi:hypothetical protein
MEIALYAIQLDATALDAIPAEFLVDFDLYVERRACFICNSGKFNHGSW